MKPIKLAAKDDGKKYSIPQTNKIPLKFNKSGCISRGSWFQNAKFNKRAQNQIYATAWFLKTP